MFTETTTSHLRQPDKQISYIFEMRTQLPESAEWEEIGISDFRLTRDVFTPAVLRVTLNLPTDGTDSVTRLAGRIRLLAEARLTVSVGPESEIVFQGRINRIEPRDGVATLTCYDWLSLINECDCEVNRTPQETDELTGTRLATLVGDGRFGNVFGFTYDGPGDPAFNSGEDPGSRRRAWAPGDIRLYYDSAATAEVPPLHYRINLTGGTVTILEDTAGRSYYVTGVRCYIEGTLDWSEVFRDALQWPGESGGIGAGPTDLDIPDTGLDLAGPLFFKGRVCDLIGRIQQEQQANLRLWFDSTTGRYKLRTIVQAERGAEDWVLQCPVTITQVRDLRDFYSRIVVTGKRERPRNALTEATTVVTDITGSGDWFAWDGLNVGADDDSVNLLPLLYDGDMNLGPGVHNLAESATGGTDKYDSWYDFIQVDLGREAKLERILVTMPGSRNLNAVAGHQGLFWPGIRIYGSRDGTTWSLVSLKLYGRFAPGSQQEVSGQDIICRKARYLRVQLGAFKHGTANQHDPGIGLAELEIIADETYEIVKEIQGTDTEGKYLYTDGEVWPTYFPKITQLLGERHRTKRIDLGGEFNEYLANDYAVDQLAESIRLFSRISYRAVADPRVGLFDTVSGLDALDADIAGFLVERIETTPQGTWVHGTDYRSRALGEEGGFND